MKFHQLSLLVSVIAAGSLHAFEDYYGNQAPSAETYQFNDNGRKFSMTLSHSEICKVDNAGHATFMNQAGGVNSILQSASQAPEDTFLVFYPTDGARTPESRQVLRNRFLIKIKPGVSAEEIRQRCGISSIEVMFPEKGLAVGYGQGAVDVLDLLVKVSGDPGVIEAEPLFARERFKRKVPADPFFGPPNGFDNVYQWYLTDPDDFPDFEVPGVHINVSKAWDLSGSGGPIDGNTAQGQIRITVVDDGVFGAHSDINLSGENNLNLVEGGTDPSPTPATPFDTHGTAVAGIIGAIWDNDEGISGIAPEADLIGVRLLGPLMDDADEAAALSVGSDITPGFDSVDISNNSWGPSDLTTRLEDIGDLAKAAIETATQSQRIASTGTVFVWAGGNGGEASDNSNYDGYANLPETIAVGAVTDQGVRASYSEKGANLVVTAPSGGGTNGIVAPSFEYVAPTFDPDSGEEVTPAALTESYVNDFGGTSAAAPIVSGAVALMLDARRWLNWREVQQILMKTAQRIDEGHPDWYQNAAGFWFNHEYGAGLVDVEAAVNLVNAIPLTPPSNGIYLADRGEPLEEEVFDVQAIPDGDGSSYILTFDLSKEPNRSVEHVELYTTIIGERRADLDVVLVSPSGTQSVLAESHQNSTERSISDWTFMTVRNWGEGSAGKWHLRITDRIPGNQARFNNAVLRVHGPEDAEAPLLTGPVLISDRVINGVEGVQLDYSFDVEGVTSIQVNNLPDGLVFNSEELTLTGVPAEGGVTNTELILSGPDGVNTTSLSISIRPVTFALGAAVEQPDRISTANGDLEWDFEFSETLDGVDSLGSPFGVPENLQARFGFDNVSSGVAIFNWKVSSAEGLDRLWVTLNNGQVPSEWSAFVDGNTDWSPIGVQLPNNLNSIDWVYSKGTRMSADDPVSSGRDRGFVDLLEFQEFDTYDKSLRASGNFIGFPEDPADPNYVETVYGSRTLWLPVDDGTAPSDLASLRASGIGNGQKVAIGFWLDGAADFSFEYRTSIADDGDVLEFMVNGVVNETASGSSGGWMAMTAALPDRRNYVEIRYRKNITGSGGDDTVWLDNITVQRGSGSTDWLADHRLVSMDGDEDLDGHSNFSEYAFGGDPLMSDTPRYAPIHLTDGLNNWIEYGIDSARSDLSYEAQESTDLDNWTTTDYSVYDRTEGDIRYYRIPIFNDPSRPERYYRVTATFRQ